MKIIGRTAYGYLIDATAHDIAGAAGFTSPSECPGWKPDSPHRRWDGSFPVGVEIKPSEGLAYLNKLRAAEEAVKKAETLLRALADMLHSALPSTIIPADEPNGEIDVGRQLPT